MTEEAPNTTSQTGSQPGEMRSTISRRWLLRIVIITAVLIGYGLWSVYDAYIGYPERGADYASWSEWTYLGATLDADERESPGIARREAAIADPVAELARLRSNETRDRNLQDAQGSPRQKRAEMEIARERWLTALRRIGRLDPAYTNFYENPDPVALERMAELQSLDAAARTPAQREELSALQSAMKPQGARERYAQLEQRWLTESQPGQLQSYDIPVNKLAAVICFGFALYLMYLFVMVATRTYRWLPAEQRLTLPSGESLRPADLADIDKRKWEKFIVFLKVKDSHPKLANAEIKVDTYRHGLVEEWILDMEKTAFPDRVEEEEASKAVAAGKGEASEAASASGSDAAAADGAGSEQPVGNERQGT